MTDLTLGFPGSATSRPRTRSIGTRSSHGYQGRHVVVAGSRRRTSNHRRGRHMAALIVMLGVAVLLYPVVATEFNNRKQREFAEQYNHQVAAADPGKLSALLAQAREYNTALAGIPILDPWLTKVSRDPRSAAYQDYLSRLSGLSAMARVRVPSIGVDLPIYHGTSEDTLAKGVGHLYGTALPVGGSGLHSVLTSHTGLSNATLLDHLIDVKEGDRIFVDVAGQTLAYEVDQITIVLPNQIDDLKPVAGADLITLFTCTPYAVNSHRLLVRGHRVPFEAAAADVASTLQTRSPALEGWMYWQLGAAGVSLLILVGLGARLGAGLGVGLGRRSVRAAQGGSGGRHRITGAATPRGRALRSGSTPRG